MPPVIHHSLLKYPILKFHEDGTPKKVTDLYEYIAEYFRFSKEKMEIMIRKGEGEEPQYQHDIRNKMTVLKDNGLITKINDGEYQITSQGIHDLEILEIENNNSNMKTSENRIIHFFLHFKENLQNNTFEEHNKLLQKNKVVWWGNDGRSIGEETLSKIKDQINKNIKTKVYLYEMGSKNWYLGTLSDISNNKPLDIQNIPEYYRDDLCKSYLKFSKLIKLDFTAIPRRIRNPLVYVYEKNGEGPEYIHVIENDLPIIESVAEKLDEKYAEVREEKRLIKPGINENTQDQLKSIPATKFGNDASLDKKLVEYNIDLNKFEINTLFFPSEQKERLIQQITTAIKNGKHLILIGPPGTGKSKLAKIISDAYCNSPNNYKMCTATSDWSTFDTIGGYRPNSQKNGELEFAPGIFLQCFQNKACNPINKWLILDEINRADIDKAFGSLFSALTGDTITIPFERDGNEIRIIGSYDDDFKRNKEMFVVPKNWRLIATMNNFDKSSLYQMSYAFMRRFAFINVEIPIKIDDNVIREYVKIWELEKDDKIISKLSYLWGEINKIRRIGPSIIKDLYQHLLSTNSSNAPAYTDAINMYVIPQFEGLEESKIIDFINALIKTGIIEQPDILKRFASDFFGIPIQNFKS